MRAVILALLTGVSAAAAAQAGGTWSAFGDPQRETGGGVVTALTVGPNGSLYAGGYFTSIAGVEALGVARWDGAAWRALGGGVGFPGEGPSYLDALAVAPNGDLYAFGSFRTAGGVAARDVARWDGAAWSAIGDGTAQVGVLDEVYAGVIGPDGTLYVGGRDYGERDAVLRWDGAAWVRVGGGVQGNAWTLAFGPDGALYAGGEYLQPTGTVASNAVARWDGATWTGIGVDDGGRESPVFSLAFNDAGDLFAGGSFSAVGGTPARNVVRWNGTDWFALANLDSPFALFDLTADGDGLLYAAGSTGMGQTAVARWDGAEWTAIGAVGAGGGGAYVVAEWNGEIVVGGNFTEIGGVAAVGIARFAPAPVASEALPAGASAPVVSPNPARGAAIVALTHPGGPLGADVFDALGRRVGGVPLREAAAGAQTLALPTAGLPPGVYVVRVRAGAEAHALRVTVAR